MRSQVVGVTAVLADGSCIGSLAGLPKETVGLHWPSLLAGSEGTLGVITAVRLRVVPWYRSTATAMVTTRSLAAAVAVLAGLRTSTPHLDAVELVLPEAMALVAGHLGAAPPVASPGPEGAYLVVECADHADPTDELIDALADRPDVVDAAVTTEGPARERLVAFRDRITEAIGAQGVPLKLDVAVPIARLDELLAAVRASIAAHGGRLVPFGHLAEGNVHVNVLDAGDADAITADVLGAAAGLGGTISAEHGVGVAKARWLHLVRTPAELAAMTAVKHALDPAGLLNPGVLSPEY
jgi:FAD/FMN-containing dehydrogenase